MKQLYAGIVTFLTGAPLLVPHFGDRVFPVGRVPPGVEPDDGYLTYQMLGDFPTYSHLREVSEFADPQFQFIAYFGRKPGAVERRIDAEDALRNTLKDYNGSLGDVPECSVSVESLVPVPGATDDGGPFEGEAIVVTTTIEHVRTD